MWPRLSVTTLEFRIDLRRNGVGLYVRRLLVSTRSKWLRHWLRGRAVERRF